MTMQRPLEGILRPGIHPPRRDDSQASGTRLPYRARSPTTSASTPGPSPLAVLGTAARARATSFPKLPADEPANTNETSGKSKQASSSMAETDHLPRHTRMDTKMSEIAGLLRNARSVQCYRPCRRRRHMQLAAQTPHIQKLGCSRTRIALDQREAGFREVDVAATRSRQCLVDAQHRKSSLGPLVLFPRPRHRTRENTARALSSGCSISFLSQVPDVPPNLIATFQQRCRDVGEPGVKWHWHWRELQSVLRAGTSEGLGRPSDVALH